MTLSNKERWIIIGKLFASAPKNNKSAPDELFIDIDFSDVIKDIFETNFTIESKYAGETKILGVLDYRTTNNG